MKRKSEFVQETSENTFNKKSSGWNPQKFRKRVLEIHGEKYNYSKIDEITNQNSKIDISCKTCGYKWESNANRHINKKSGCVACSGNLVWTPTRFLQRAREIHGEKYEYTNVEDIKNCKSRINILCKVCGNKWTTSLHHHINDKTACRQCNHKQEWTMDRFVKESRLIHGERFQYELPDNIKCSSRIAVTCRNCGHQFQPTIERHIYRASGCPQCNQNAHWTRERFLEKAMKMHGTKYEYIDVPTYLRAKTAISLKCTRCHYSWKTKVTTYIHGCGCPQCAGKAKWTFDRFLEKALEINGEAFDYSKINPHSVLYSKSFVTVICKTCAYHWSTRIDNHINNQRGCPQCAGQKRWTQEEFIKTATLLHCNRYEYFPISQPHVENCVSLCRAQDYVKVKCKKCKWIWSVTISHHIHNLTGCPNCNSSKGELAVEKCLNENKICFVKEFQDRKAFDRLAYDFMFTWKERKIILEYDGEQHFNFVQYFHRTMDKFQSAQERDCKKSQLALLHNYFLIRIDNESDINTHFLGGLEASLNQNNQFYMANPSKYKYIVDKL